MSRTNFAVHFKSVAGVAPLQHLAQWRILLAQCALRASNAPLANLAAELGYSSESAFSNAFKHITEASPAHYRSRARNFSADGSPPGSAGRVLH